MRFSLVLLLSSTFSIHAVAGEAEAIQQYNNVMPTIDYNIHQKPCLPIGAIITYGAMAYQLPHSIQTAKSNPYALGTIGGAVLGNVMDGHNPKDTVSGRMGF